MRAGACVCVRGAMCPPCPLFFFFSLGWEMRARPDRSPLPPPLLQKTHVRRKRALERRPVCIQVFELEHTQAAQGRDGRVGGLSGDEELCVGKEGEHRGVRGHSMRRNRPPPPRARSVLSPTLSASVSLSLLSLASRVKARVAHPHGWAVGKGARAPGAPGDGARTRRGSLALPFLNPPLPLLPASAASPRTETVRCPWSRTWPARGRGPPPPGGRTRTRWRTAPRLAGRARGGARAAVERAGWCRRVGLARGGGGVPRTRWLRVCVWEDAEVRRGEQKTER